MCGTETSNDDGGRRNGTKLLRLPTGPGVNGHGVHRGPQEPPPDQLRFFLLQCDPSAFGLWNAMCLRRTSCQLISSIIAVPHPRRISFLCSFDLRQV
eukprot:4848838-Pyramimonas_sp.AAC.1